MQMVVGLGGSAGSIRALQAFFSRMPGDSGLAFVVVLHLSPEHENSLAALLQNVTTMRVVQVSEAVRVGANCVYVIPPGKTLLMADGQLILNDLRHENGKRAAVDIFFRTLADTHGSRSAAIVLSGADGDGTIGIKRIKEKGGLTVAQSPSEAEYDEMPRSAIATGMVDWVLPVAEMPNRLLEYQRIQRRVRLPEENPPVPSGGIEQSDDENALREALSLLQMRTGHDFSCYKRATILRRIGRRMQVNSIEELPAYLAFLQLHPSGAMALLQDLLISVTNFFRDQEAFQALQAELPKLFADKSPGDQVRVWVPGCATGEEAYSIAMVLSEHASKLNAPPQMQVFATDLDRGSIDLARAGHYPDTIAADVSEVRLRLFFTKESAGYRVKRAMRETILFAVHDLLKDPPFSRIDLISCRNLLIYLDRDAQRRAFEIFHFALVEKGFLFLGSSESIEDAGSLFTSLDKKYRLYGRRLGNRRSAPEGSASLGFALETQRSVPIGGIVETNLISATRPWPLSSVASPGSSRSWAELHLRLLERFAPPSVIVDGNYDIVHLSEHAGQYLQLAGGTSTLNLLRIVHPMLRTELCAALFRAKQIEKQVIVNRVPLEIAGAHKTIELRVSPAQDLAPDFLLVVFDAKEEVVPSETFSARSVEPLMQHLEEELDQLKAQQRESVQHHEQSTEELKASNEELQAINEELRSATEELETSREELYSINEELRTVNQELKTRVEEVGRTNNDLQNLMASTNIATIFVDQELLIKRFTPSAQSLFSLIATDLGRPIFDLRHRLEYDSLVADARQVLDQLIVVEREMRSVDNGWYFARLQPYRTTEGEIAGVVLTFVDITERKKAEEQLRRSEERLRSVIDSVQDYAICTLDVEGRVTTWKSGAARIEGYSEPEIIGKNFSILYPAEQVSAGIPDRLLAIAAAEGRAHRENCASVRAVNAFGEMN